jgi:hypothetical protein
MAAAAVLVFAFAVAACVLDRHFLSSDLFAWSLCCGIAIYASTASLELFAVSVVEPLSEETSFLRAYSVVAAVTGIFFTVISALVARANRLKLKLKGSVAVLILGSLLVNAFVQWALYSFGYNFGWQ